MASSNNCATTSHAAASVGWVGDVIEGEEPAAHSDCSDTWALLLSMPSPFCCINTSQSTPAKKAWRLISSAPPLPSRCLTSTTSRRLTKSAASLPNRSSRLSSHLTRPLTMLSITASTVSAANGGCPINRWNASTPSAHQSTAGVAGRPSTVSGAR